MHVFQPADQISRTATVCSGPIQHPT